MSLKHEPLSHVPGTSPSVSLPAVLLVEDDLVAAEVTQTLLARTGLRNRIVHFTDGNDALDWLGDHLAADDPPALALLDLHLPGCSGLEILRWLRDQRSDVPVIMLTAATDLDEINEAYALGIASYLVKPAGAGAIADIVRGLSSPWALLSQAW